MDRARGSGQPNENENGVQGRGTGGSARADETFDLGEREPRGIDRVAASDRPDRRAAAAAHAARAAGAGDLAHAARAFAHGLADRAIRDALAVADDQECRPPAGPAARDELIMPQVKMDFNIASGLISPGGSRAA